MVYQDIVEQLLFYADTAVENPVESTHQIRKKLKFLRAFVKLLKGLKLTEESTTVNVILRDVGGKFSELRDAHVRQLLLLEMKNLSKNASFLPILEQLELINQSTIKASEYSMLVEQNEFLALQEMWANNDIIDSYFDLKISGSLKILDVFASSYWKSFDAFNKSIESLDPNLLHEWRKRLKDVQYQFELLYENLNSDIQKHFLTIQDLCNVLGELNDYDMLKSWISNNQSSLKEEDNFSSMFSDQIVKQHEALLGDSMANGRKLYAYTPDQFKNQLF